MRVEAIPAFADNYIWLFAAHLGGAAEGRDDYWVVDPGDANVVLARMEALGSRLQGILITHHHFDHTGGIATLRATYPGMQVCGPATENIEGLTDQRREGDTWQCGEFTFRVFHVPGHTAGHIAYYCPESRTLFCGDTLFSGGCGRLFEGTPADMYGSLQKFAHLPDDTRVFCTHEYTQANLRFAHAVEPDNQDLNRYRAWVRAQRANDKITLPSTIGQEKAINPFLRTAMPSVQQAARQRAGHMTESAVQVLATLRAWKDAF